MGEREIQHAALLEYERERERERKTERKRSYLGRVVDEQNLAALASQQRLGVHHDLVDELRHVTRLLEDDARQIQ